MRSLTAKVLTVFGLVLLSGIAAHAAGASASATAPASATIIAPISLLNLNGTGLTFGAIVPMSGGTVTVAPDGARTSSGSVSVVPSSTATAAAFKVTGEAGYGFTITLPATTTISNGSNSMTIDTFASDPTGTGTLDSAGEKTFTVGGVLHVNDSQPTGHYTGSFEVTVAYN